MEQITFPKAEGFFLGIPLLWWIVLLGVLLAAAIFALFGRKQFLQMTAVFAALGLIVAGNQLRRAYELPEQLQQAWTAAGESLWSEEMAGGPPFSVDPQDAFHGKNSVWEGDLLEGIGKQNPYMEFSDVTVSYEMPYENYNDGGGLYYGSMQLITKFYLITDKSLRGNIAAAFLNTFTGQNGKDMSDYLAEWDETEESSHGSLHWSLEGWNEQDNVGMIIGLCDEDMADKEHWNYLTLQLSEQQMFVEIGKTSEVKKNASLSLDEIMGKLAEGWKAGAKNADIVSGYENSRFYGSTIVETPEFALWLSGENQWPYICEVRLAPQDAEEEELFAGMKQMLQKYFGAKIEESQDTAVFSRDGGELTLEKIDESEGRGFKLSYRQD